MILDPGNMALAALGLFGLVSEAARRRRNEIHHLIIELLDAAAMHNADTARQLAALDRRLTVIEDRSMRMRTGDRDV